MDQKEKLWNKDFILICVVNLLTFTSFYFLLPTLPIFVMDVLQGNAGHVGYIVGVLTLTAVLSRPVAGFMLDTLGRKTIVFIALVCFALTAFSYHIASSLLLLFSLRALHGFSWGFSSTGLGTMASDIVPSSRRGEGLGYYGMMTTIAMAIGPVLSLFVLEQYGFYYLFTICSGIAALGVIILCLIPSSVEVFGKEQRKLTLDSFLERRVFSISAIVFFMALTYGGIVSFITLYAKELGVGNPGVYFLVYAISILAVRPYSGKIFDHEGPVRIMGVGLGSIMVAFIVLYMASGTLIFLLSAVIMGIGFGIVQPINMAMAIKRVEPFRRGAANGTLMSANDLGIGLGSVLLGMLSGEVGMSFMYLVCAVIIMVPLAIFYMKDAREGGEEGCR